MPARTNNTKMSIAKVRETQQRISSILDGKSLFPYNEQNWINILHKMSEQGKSKMRVFFIYETEFIKALLKNPEEMKKIQPNLPDFLSTCLNQVRGSENDKVNRESVRQKLYRVKPRGIKAARHQEQIEMEQMNEELVRVGEKGDVCPQEENEMVQTNEELIHVEEAEEVRPQEETEMVQMSEELVPVEEEGDAHPQEDNEMMEIDVYEESSPTEISSRFDFSDESIIDQSKCTKYFVDMMPSTSNTSSSNEEEMVEEMTLDEEMIEEKKERNPEENKENQPPAQSHFQRLLAQLDEFCNNDDSDTRTKEAVRELKDAAWFNEETSPSTLIRKISNYFESWRISWKNMRIILENAGFCCGVQRKFERKEIRCDGSTEKVPCSITKKFNKFTDENTQKVFNYCIFHFKKLELPCSINGVHLMEKPKVKLGEVSMEEELEGCLECGRLFHRTCKDVGKIPDRGSCGCATKSAFSPEQLKITACSEHMEKTLREWADASEETKKIAKAIRIRVISSFKKPEEFDEEGEISKIYQRHGKSLPKWNPNHRTILCFYKKENNFILIFAMKVKEYGPGCSSHEGTVVIDYLDSVSFIEDKSRSKIYRRIIDGYFSYTKSIGFRRAHWWAATPKENDAYLLNRQEVKSLPQEGLMKWYRSLVATSDEIEDKENRTPVLSDYEEDDISFIEKLFFGGGFFEKVISAVTPTLKKMAGKPNAEVLERIKTSVFERAMKEGMPIFNLNFFADESQLGPLKIMEDREMRSKIADTRESWLAVQRWNGMEFSKEDYAISATSKLVEVLLKEQKESN